MKYSIHFDFHFLQSEYCWYCEKLGFPSVDGDAKESVQYISQSVEKNGGKQNNHSVCVCCSISYKDILKMKFGFTTESTSLLNQLINPARDNKYGLIYRTVHCNDHHKDSFIYQCNLHTLMLFIQSFYFIYCCALIRWTMLKCWTVATLCTCHCVLWAFSVQVIV